MSDIDELQRRITAAMDRVASGLDQLGANSSDDSARLEQALEEEKSVNAELTERARVLNQRQEVELAAATQMAEAANARMAELDEKIQRVRKANDGLRELNDALRVANEAGVGEPHLINKSMMAELEALRAARAVDVSEVTAIIEALTPLINEAEGVS
jgi:DNA repair exonuclease SbcCD ATPase subunit